MNLNNIDMKELPNLRTKIEKFENDIIENKAFYKKAINQREKDRSQALFNQQQFLAETARLTDDRVDLTEDAVNELSRRIHEAFASGREIRIIHFVPDDRKDGGAYVEITGKIRKIEAGEIILEDGSRIQTENVVDAGWADP